MRFSFNFIFHYIDERKCNNKFKQEERKKPKNFLRIKSYLYVISFSKKNKIKLEEKGILNRLASSS